MANELAWSFVVQTVSGVVAVFVGIWLALVVERRRRAQDAAEREADLRTEFDRIFDSILSSVIKNTAEAKRVLRLLGNPRCPRMLHADLETAVWYASHAQFSHLCNNVDQRVIFAQFFDDVRRLQAFVDFRTNLHVSMTTQHLDATEDDVHQLSEDVDKHLAALAEDLRFCGMLLVTDHGKPVHKRLMGIQVPDAVA
jgi:hypothetical protein